MERTDFDTAFSCPVCFEPSVNIVYGNCQHFMCSRCLYDEIGWLRSAFLRCPLCKKFNAFPPLRPFIPEVTRQLMRIAGIVECKHETCNQEMWTWEQDEHEKSCPAGKKATRSNAPRSARSSRAKATDRVSESPAAIGPGSGGRVGKRRK